MTYCFATRQSVIHPVAEYACPVWHSGLTVDQSDRIESIQRRAMKIIFNDCVSIDALQLANLPLLPERRVCLTRCVMLTNYFMTYFCLLSLNTVSGVPLVTLSLKRDQLIALFVGSCWL